MRKISAATEPASSFCSAGLSKALLRHKLCTQQQIDEAAKAPANCKLLTALLERGIVDDQRIARFVTGDLKIRHFTFQSRADLEKAIDRQLLARFDRDFVIRLRALPLGLKDGSMEVAFADPLDIEAVNKFRSVLSSAVNVVFAHEHDIIHAIDLLFQANFRDVAEDGPEKNRRIGDFSAEDVIVAVAEAESKGKAGAEAAPIIKLVNKIMADASALGASDVHVEPNAANLEIRLRIDGVMNQYLTLPKKVQPYVLTRLKLMSGMDITERRKPQDGRFRMQTGADSSQDVRASSVPTPFGEKLVLRDLKVPAGATVTLLGREGALTHKMDGTTLTGTVPW